MVWYPLHSFWKEISQFLIVYHTTWLFHWFWIAHSRLHQFNNPTWLALPWVLYCPPQVLLSSFCIHCFAFSSSRGPRCRIFWPFFDLATTIQPLPSLVSLLLVLLWNSWGSVCLSSSDIAQEYLTSTVRLAPSIFYCVHPLFYSVFVLVRLLMFLTTNLQCLHYFESRFYLLQRAHLCLILTYYFVFEMVFKAID